MSEPISILSLGDSYTVGEGVPAAAAWPSRLAEHLAAEGFATGRLEIVAQTGWTTGELEAAIEQRELQPGWDLVTLLIGVNDQYRGRGVDSYEPRFAGLLDGAIGLAGGKARRVIVVSIPDWGRSPFAEGRDRARIAREIDAFNRAARAVASERGAHWVDVTTESRSIAGLGSFVDDGLHPAASSYEAWSRLVLPVALEVLEADD